MADKNFGRNFSQDSVEMGTDPASFRDDTSFRLQSVDPGNELVVRSCMIAQNWDRPDLQRRQEVNIHLLGGTNSNQDPVTRYDLFFPQLERQIINEPIQSRISQDSIAGEAAIDKCRNTRLKLGSFSEGLNKIHYQSSRIENRLVNVSCGGIT